MHFVLFRIAQLPDALDDPISGSTTDSRINGLSLTLQKKNYLKLDQIGTTEDTNQEAYHITGSGYKKMNSTTTALASGPTLPLELSCKDRTNLLSIVHNHTIRPKDDRC